MIENPRKFYLRCAGGVALASLVLFLIFYIPIYVMEISSEVWDYFRYFIIELGEFLIPALGAILLFVGSYNAGKGAVLLRALAFSATRFVYLFPYYYLYETAFGYDWIESILLSLLISTVAIVIDWLHVLLIYMVIYYVAKRMINKELLPELPAAHRKKLPPEKRCEHEKRIHSAMGDRMNERGIFNLALPITAGIFAGSFTEFCYNTVIEVIYVIEHLVEYGDFRTAELIYTLSKFLFIFAELFIAHALGYFIKTLITERDEKNGNKDVQALGE